jgi:hypothetical protein
VTTDGLTFSARTWIVLGLFGLLLAGLLGTLVVLIERQRELITRQTEIAEAQRVTVRNLLGAGRTVLDDAQARMPALQRGARQAGGLLRETRPLIDELNRVDVAGALAGVGALAARLAEGDRTVELIDRGNALLAATARFDTVEDIDATRDMTRESLAIQRELLALQRRSLAVLEESLAIQRETLVHTRNIDRKTGPAPP